MIALGIVYPGTSYTEAEDYAKLLYSFDNPAVPVNPDTLLTPSMIIDANGETRYMELAPESSEAYGRSIVGRYIGPYVSDLNTTMLFTSETFSTAGIDYRIVKLPVHLTL